MMDLDLDLDCDGEEAEAEAESRHVLHDDQGDHVPYSGSQTCFHSLVLPWLFSCHGTGMVSGATSCMTQNRVFIILYHFAPSCSQS